MAIVTRARNRRSNRVAPPTWEEIRPEFAGHLRRLADHIEAVEAVHKWFLEFPHVDQVPAEYRERIREAFGAGAVNALQVCDRVSKHWRIGAETAGAV